MKIFSCVAMEETRSTLLQGGSNFVCSIFTLAWVHHLWDARKYSLLSGSQQIKAPSWVCVRTERHFFGNSRHAHFGNDEQVNSSCAQILVENSSPATATAAA
jgi:hypothetical protein